MALRRKAFLAALAALAAFALIRRAFPANRVTVRRRTRHNSDVDSSNCALLANGTRGASAANAKPRALPPLLRPVKPI